MSESWTDTIYTLNRGSLTKEQERLEWNHYNVWLPLTGSLVPAPIEAHLKSRPASRVADIGTGTGVWLRALSELLPPEADLRGFDIDTSKFPPPEALPSNVSLARHSATAPFPAEDHGTYDLVHVRLLVFALKAHEWEVVARGAQQLLRPGGMMLWEESVDLSWQSLPPNQLYQSWWDATARHGILVGRDISMTSALARMLRGSGYVGCDEKIWSTWGGDERVRINVVQTMMDVARPTLLAVVEAGISERFRTADDIDATIQTLTKEIEGGMRLGMNWAQAWGTKPLPDAARP